MIRLLKREMIQFLHNFHKKENISRPLLVAQAGIGDFVLGLSLVEKLAQSREKSVDLIAVPEVAPLTVLSPWVGNVHVLAGGDAPTAELLATIKMAAYTSIYSLRTSDSLLVPLLDACPSARYIAHPTYERMRLMPRLFSVISKKFRVKYYEKLHMSQIQSSMTKAPAPRTMHGLEVPLLSKNVMALIPDMNKPTTIIHVGGRDPIRRPYPSTLAKVIQQLQNVILVGFGEADAFSAEQIVLANTSASILNLVNRLSLVDIVALLNASSLCIVPDSAIMHLAACCRVPIVALMGNARPKTFGPFRSDNVQVLDLIPPCSPCSVRVCAKYNGGSCIQAISAERILEAVAAVAPIAMKK